MRAHHGLARRRRIRPGSTRCRRRPRPTARSWCAPWRSASAAPTARSSPASTAGRRRARTGWFSATNRSAGSSRRRRAAALHRAISWSASCAGPTRCRAPPAPPANGTCAATAATPSAASRQRDGFGAERFRIEPDFAVKIDPALGMLGVLLEPTSVVAKAWDHIERIGRARVVEPADACWSPAPGRSACSPR